VRPLPIPSASLALAAALAVGAAGVVRGAPDAASIPSRLALDDGLSRRARREIHDVTHVRVEAKDAALDVLVRFRRPLRDGVFECVHVYIDCDADAQTGKDGADLWVRAAVGSRYQRTSASAPLEGAPPPAELRRSSFSVPHTQAIRGGPGLKTWLHKLERRIAPPTVDDTDLRFEVPLDLVAEQGLRYNGFVRLRVEAEGSCSESPLWLEYVCADEGTPIAKDGRDADWSGQARAVDVTGELHPDADEVDLVSLEVDHDASHVHALVRLAGAGFGGAGHDADVDDRDRVTVALEPLGSGRLYMDYAQAVLTTGQASRFGVVGRRMVEFSIPRAPAQTAFRVVAWSDAIRVDKVPDAGWAEVGVPPEAFRPR